jgi:hypothetical protein
MNHNMTAAFAGLILAHPPGKPPEGAPPPGPRMEFGIDPKRIGIYAKGQHGFGTAKQGLPVDHWLDAFYAWLAQQGFVPKIQ